MQGTQSARHDSQLAAYSIMVVRCDCADELALARQMFAMASTSRHRADAIVLHTVAQHSECPHGEMSAQLAAERDG